ncbi:MAG: hypothetical protein COV46_06815 [Deltaproteobacteria bacterium CG11_big_fil_rev_8_21_14_0_20_49_13]|nr:MAG: hypothetical protein COV46_06815 [Deltaproteobacteria bacterium CG11_big_fil_rev_8_21_14_0_20_49_13]
MKNIPAIILSAGASKRMGFPKALIKVEDHTLLEDQISRLKKAGCSPIFVVLGANAHVIASLPRATGRAKQSPEHNCVREIATSAKGGLAMTVTNRRWRLGQFSSIKCGLRALKNISGGAIILPVDVPFVPASVIKKILHHASPKYSAVIPTALRARDSMIARSREKGHPIWLSPHLIKKVLRTSSKAGRLDRILGLETKIALVRTTSKAILNNVNFISGLK